MMAETMKQQNDPKLPPVRNVKTTRLIQIMRGLSGWRSNAGSRVVYSSSSMGSPKDVGNQGPSRALWFMRLIFPVFLIGVAALVGFLAYYLVAAAEENLAEQQYEALVGRVLNLAEELTDRRRVVTKSMANVAASAYPNAEAWPNVAIPAFGTFAADLIRTSDTVEIGFYPMVQPAALSDEPEESEQTSFELFAYNYFYNIRIPPYPDGTATHSFGKGVWISRGARDTSGYGLGWESPNQVLFPELQNSNDSNPNGSLFLMFNIHGDIEKGPPIDDVIACAKERKETNNRYMDCGVVTRISSWNRASYLIQPIYPANDLLDFTGVIMSRVSWDINLARMFEDTVATGITAVLESEGKSYSYSIHDGGTAVFSGDGDLHDPRFASYGQTIALEGSSSREYYLTLYPTEEFFRVFSTSNPMVACVGAVFIVIVTSLIFFIYDFMVRREFSAKQHLLQAKRRFMRFVSHEVRTPLNAVCMGLTLLMEELTHSLKTHNESAVSIDGESSVHEEAKQACALDTLARPDPVQKDLKEYLMLAGEIYSSAQSSVDVLNDLLNYDKIEMGNIALELTQFSMSNLLHETSSEFRLSAQKKGVNFHLVERNQTSRPPEELRHRSSVGDKMRITQVLRNLVSNALKFTPEGGDATIRTSWLEPKMADHKRMDKYTLVSGEDVVFQHGGSIQIEVVDTGAGMSQSQLKMLGREGMQFNVNKLQAGQGSGLGLFISKGILKQHGGHLDVFSKGLGHGTTFTFTLPLYNLSDIPTDSTTKVSDGELLESKEEIESAGPLKVLVVDDVLSNRKLLIRLVQNRGHDTDEAEDGQDAIDKVKDALRANKPFDVILMDHEMPVLSGPEAAKEIRLSGCNSLIVGITGNILTEDVQYFTACGANCVLPKPVQMNKLEELWIEHGVCASTRFPLCL